MAIVASSPERRWLSGIVPFEIDGAVFPAGSPERGIVDMAISQFNGASTTIKLQPRNGDLRVASTRSGRRWRNSPRLPGTQTSFAITLKSGASSRPSAAKCG